jgi:hypothetical protein
VGEELEIQERLEERGLEERGLEERGLDENTSGKQGNERTNGVKLENNSIFLINKY